MEPVPLREDTSVTMNPNYKDVVGLKFKDLDALPNLWEASREIARLDPFDDIPTPTIWRDGDGYKAFWTSMVWEEPAAASGVE